MIEFKSHHYATPNELMELGKDHQLPLTSQKEKTTFDLPDGRKKLKLNLIKSLHLTTNLQGRQGTMFLLFNFKIAHFLI